MDQEKLFDRDFQMISTFRFETNFILQVVRAFLLGLYDLFYEH